ncbi:quinone oxidoreductase-like protein 2 isoform X2 [Hypanus sabinus]|uniref:quinone oxidoreductase-like protein 2 isoform X2 n=1 Tax=Hypanus sabinus TaxID=79690 RepID=UPI0028C3AE49|nr:quinone oxidoreductase-like protein 2 isoform X2 [Hypanus sabinus]
MERVAAVGVGSLLRAVRRNVSRRNNLLRHNPRLAEIGTSSAADSKDSYLAVQCTDLKRPLEIQRLPSVALKPTEVRVDIHCCGVNFADILICRGLYQHRPRLPFTPGMEFAGSVTEVGTNVTGVSKVLWLIDETISFEMASVLPVSYGTAILALQHRANTQPGETVLVTAAAGAAGLAAVDIASRILNAKVIAAAGTDEKSELALQRGAVAAINYTTQSLKEEVKKLTGNKGVDVVFDAVGGDVFKEAFSSLSWEGRIVVVGFAGGNISTIPANQLLLKNVTAMGVFWGKYKDQHYPVFSRSITSAIQFCKEGRISPYIGSVFKMQQVNEAFQHVLQRKSIGKVILNMK